ncbi:MAG: hypothetical protein AB1592_03880 [Pseudomonadota bacterium]
MQRVYVKLEWKIDAAESGFYAEAQIAGKQYNLSVKRPDPDGIVYWAIVDVFLVRCGVSPDFETAQAAAEAACATL